MDIDEEELDFEKERKTRKRRDENVKRIVSLLIDFGKEFEIKEWGDGEGTDIIIKETEYNQVDNKSEEYKQTISINDNEFLTFERQEKQDDK